MKTATDSAVEPCSPSRPSARAPRLSNKRTTSVVPEVPPTLEAARGHPRPRLRRHHGPAAVDLADDEVLRRLVALNAERAAEERRGLVRWLRPAFQNPGGATAATTTSTQAELTLPEPAASKAKAGQKPAWPTTLPEQAAAVRAALAANAAPTTAGELARRFRGARADRVAQLLATLAMLGQARPAGDGRFAA